MKTPLISILLAVRNEEALILNCLKALLALDYPQEYLQILIGNDDSQDNTKAIILDFIKGKPNFCLLDIDKKIGSQQGKGNVLAQLAQKAVGEYYFFTDADVIVPPTWVRAMLQGFEAQNIGIVTGFTWLRGSKSIEIWQALEWANALNMYYILAKLNVPITAMGNNMALSAEAYWAVGGYEAIPFSVTEDYTLFWAIIHKGFRFQNIINTQVCAQSLPLHTFADILTQRRRWIDAAMQSWQWQMLLFGRAFTSPFLIVLLFFYPRLALFLGGGGILTSLLSLGNALQKTKKMTYMAYFPAYLVYQEVLLVRLFFYYFQTKKVVWKGREF